MRLQVYVLIYMCMMSDGDDMSNKTGFVYVSCFRLSKAARNHLNFWYTDTGN